MWSRNLVNTIQTVAQAVAPPIDSDEEYDEEEEYSDDEEQDDSEPVDDDDDVDRQVAGSRLGFVGLLTRAMDRQEEEDEEEDARYEEVDGIGKNIAYNTDNHSVDERNEITDRMEEDSEPGTPPPQLMSPEKRESGSVHAKLLKATPEVLQQLHMLDTDEDESTDSFGVGDHETDSLAIREVPDNPIIQREQMNEERDKQEPKERTPEMDTQKIEPNEDISNESAPSTEQLSVNSKTNVIQHTDAAENGDKIATVDQTIKLAAQANNQATLTSPLLLDAPINATETPRLEPERGAEAQNTQLRTPPIRKFAQPPSPTPPTAHQSKDHQHSHPSPPSASKIVLPRPPSLRPTTPASVSEKQQQLEARCRRLEEELANAKEELSIRNTSKADDLDVLSEQIRQQESQRLQQARATHQQELETVTRQFEARIEQLEQDMRHEQKAFEKERRQITSQLQNQADNSRIEREFAKQQEQLIQTMTLLDEREHQVLQLRQTIKNLEGLVQENKAANMENEDILDEIHQENDQLRNHVEQAEARCEVLKAKVEELQHQQDKSAHIQLELRMLKEELDRERAKSQNAVVSAVSNNQLLEEERDAALALVEDFRQQLAATAADLDVARADYQRILTANNNLQLALESFQSEREAEVGMLQEQQREAEETLAAAHAATIEAINGTHAEQLRQLQSASDAALRNSHQEIQKLESQLKKYESENIQMRRSLDEAIHRLQMNQEDVIDRTLMKNILMDWLTKTGVKERKDVLELMASVLHFSDEEKERVHISSSHIASSLLGKLAGPVPAPKADMENLQGDTVGEKWVSFLLAETED